VGKPLKTWSKMKKLIEDSRPVEELSKDLLFGYTMRKSKVYFAPGGNGFSLFLTKKELTNR